MTTKERLDRHDRQIAAIRDLVHEGMRLLIAPRKDIRVLVNAQKELMATSPQAAGRGAKRMRNSGEVAAPGESVVREFLGMKRGMNGHRKRKLARKGRAGAVNATKEAACALRFAGCYLGDLQ
jgi:hypothetical protein